MKIFEITLQNAVAFYEKRVSLDLFQNDNGQTEEDDESDECSFLEIHFHRYSTA